MDKYICRYCGKICKNQNSLTQHEVRCKENPDHIVCCGNKGNMPEHNKSWNNKRINVRGEILDITNEQLALYRDSHPTCEICGKTIDETIKWKSKFAPKRLCVDHDHISKRFRGLLCPLCNRQLGWYEKNKDAIDKYLHK